MKQKNILLTLLFISSPILHAATPNQNHEDPISITTEIAVGELIDKITILQIKLERIKDPVKLKNITLEYSLLSQTLSLNIPLSEELSDLIAQLLTVNKKLWDIENAIRQKEADKEFDQIFIQLARSVYINNRERARIKQLINTLVGSHLTEEKEYTRYEETTYEK